MDVNVAARHACWRLALTCGWCAAAGLPHREHDGAPARAAARCGAPCCARAPERPAAGARQQPRCAPPRFHFTTHIAPAQLCQSPSASRAQLGHGRLWCLLYPCCTCTFSTGQAGGCTDQDMFVPVPCALFICTSGWECMCVAGRGFCNHHSDSHFQSGLPA